MAKGHVSGVHRTHHQEYIKLKLQLLVQIMVSQQQPSASVAQLGNAGGRLLLCHYDLYQKLQLQFDVLLMVGAIDTRNM